MNRQLMKYGISVGIGGRMLIKKLYLDIECSHKSGQIRKNEKWKFSDWKGFELNKGGVIGVLGLGIDTSRNTWKELIFRQYVHCPRLGRTIGDNDRNELFDLMLERADMILTYNGRSFDIPVIIENFVPESIQTLIFNKIMGKDSGKDRDLMDVCISRKGMWIIGGGLPGTIKKLKVDYNMKKMKINDKEIYLYNIDIAKSCNDVFFDDDRGDFRGGGGGEDELSNILAKNENDIRALPLLEQALGLFWSQRGAVDKYHKVWDSFYEALEKEKMGEI